MLGSGGGNLKPLNGGSHFNILWEEEYSNVGNEHKSGEISGTELDWTVC